MGGVTRFGNNLESSQRATEALALRLFPVILPTYGLIDLPTPLP
jgi:hypothetical protein